MKTTLDSRHLAALCAVARHSSFTRAAQELHLTQSAVSHVIRSLEEDVGCRLIDRVGKRALLTQAGEQFHRHAVRILREMRDARQSVEQLLDWGHGRLRVGASTTACQYLLPSVLREFRQSFPKCVIRIESGDFSRQLELLRGNQIDLAITLKPAEDRDLVFTELFRDELRFVVSPLHRWARAGRVARDEIPDETLILYNKGSYTFGLVGDYFGKEGVGIRTFIELGSMEAIKELAKIGLGAGVLAPWVARRELEQGSLVSLPLGRAKLRRTWGTVHLRGRKPTLAEETFLGLCETVSELLVAD
jgi:DNA-binding transcriptional LysR family regulator